MYMSQYYTLLLCFHIKDMRRLYFPCMPIGVPKVPFQGPDDETSTWVDVYNRLYRQRSLFLCDEIDSEISNNITGIMVFLSIENPSKDQFLFINSPGGGIIPGIGIYDAIQLVPPDVHTVAIGLAASLASFILVGGTVTKRMAFPHARVMIHQPRTAFIPDSQQTREFFLEVDELAAMRDDIIDVYVQRTGKPAWLISLDMERDVFMSATEAKAYGIVDEISA
uniref:ATP-dependent Clp protease proteolytic subunit n=1 Tax=Vatica odorata TaxID=64582 RepID=A0A8F7KVC1_9ROSI|nr:clp protease proteolytic subunit [Vatica odorata]